MTTASPTPPPPASQSPGAGQTAVRQGERVSPFTGERPGWDEDYDYDYARHVAAYRFASTLVAGKRVLDAGCGEGFGTWTLADAAAEVVGVDYSADAVAECRRLWCSQERPNLRFERVDLTRPEDFAERFDVVLCFQVIEHIHDTRPFLDSLAARLAPGGTLVLTTPNRLGSFFENPFHVREFTADELRAEVEKAFPRVQMLGVFGNAKVQRFDERRARAVARILRLDPLGLRHRLLPRRLVEFAFARLSRVVRRQARGAGVDPAERIVPEDFHVTDTAVDRALDLVAVCRGA